MSPDLFLGSPELLQDIRKFTTWAYGSDGLPELRVMAHSDSSQINKHSLIVQSFSPEECSIRELDHFV